jgi:hypothetical protein
MSMVGQAILISTEGVIKAATWAGDRLLQQPVDPIGEVLRGAGEGPGPVIAIYVESSDFDVIGRQSQGRKATVELKVFVYLGPGRVAVPKAGAGEDEFFFLDQSTPGLLLNLIARQVDAAFHGDGDWVQIWRKFVSSITRRRVQYLLVEVENGVKIPTLEISYTLETIPDPDFGAPLTAAWSMLDAKLRSGGDEQAALADLFKAMIVAPEGLPSYRDIQNNLGLTPAALAAIGLGPVHPDAVDPDTGELPVLTEVGIVGEVTIGGPDELP